MKRAVKLWLRASALPLAFLCPGSVRAAELPIDERHEAGDLGTACHEGLRALPLAGSVDWQGVPALAKRHRVDEDDLGLLLALGQKHWASLRESFPGAVTEKPFRELLWGSVTLTGHADLYARSASTAHVGDWKSGYLDGDYSEQLRGYAALALLGDDSLDAATAGVIWLRAGDYENYTMSRAELEPFLDRIRRVIVDWDGTYHAGRHCKGCKRQHECPARAALARSTVDAFLGARVSTLATSDAALETLPPEELHALLASADLVQGLAEQVRTRVRGLVERNGDIVHPVSGARLTLERTEKRHLNVVQSFPVLTDAGFEDADMAEVIEISLPKAEKIIASKAPYRGGKKAREALRAQLEAAGAITVEPVARLVTRRA